MKRFEGKTALITGAQRGLGLEIAKHFASQGANTVLTDVTDAVIDVAKEIEQEFRTKSLGLKGDVTKADDCANMIQKTLASFSSLDILVNNAGITRDTLVLRMKEEDFDAVINVNLKGAFLMCKTAAKAMLKQRSGRIINISSVVGQMGNAGQANYAASKAGLLGLTKSLAREFASRNILVNAVSPGFITTKMTENLKDEAKEKLLEMIPLKRLGRPEDVAKAVLFLASDDSSYITGQNIAVNGGIYL
ncbi:MAG: 3-oxoacyl-[acyl-carrier-protein] reductase [Elusimicrobia bacterium]|nr:3-oxoacyl-[acyl-carrier-protein] reductase [Elusimicrobiota bacterium]